MNVKAAKNKIFLYGNWILEIAENGKKLLLAALENIDSSRTTFIELTKVNRIGSAGIQLLLSFIRSPESRDTDFEISRNLQELVMAIRIVPLESIRGAQDLVRLRGEFFLNKRGFVILGLSRGSGK